MARLAGISLLGEFQQNGDRAIVLDLYQHMRAEFAHLGRDALFGEKMSEAVYQRASPG